MPVLDGADDSYFAPLKSFKAPDTKIYLGVIHHMDDRAEFTRLVSAAARNIADFGIAAPCGFGREPRPAAGLLKEHVDATGGAAGASDVGNDGRVGWACGTAPNSSPA